MLYILNLRFCHSKTTAGVRNHYSGYLDVSFVIYVTIILHTPNLACSAHLMEAWNVVYYQHIE